VDSGFLPFIFIFFDPARDTSPQLRIAMPTTELTQTYPREISVNDSVVYLRLVTRDDHDAFLSFARTLDPADLLFLRMDITKEEVIEKWIKSIESGQRVAVVAEMGGKIVGYGSLNRKELAWSRHLGEIRIIVHQEYRRTGVGSKLAEEVYSIARDLGLVKIVAQMPADHPGGRRMFEGLGFKPEALLTDWVIDTEGRTHDLVIMSYDVTGIH
jgi:L-amino acid N-acyltransferase YncA